MLPMMMSGRTSIIAGRSEQGTGCRRPCAGRRACLKMPLKHSNYSTRIRPILENRRHFLIHWLHGYARGRPSLRPYRRRHAHRAAPRPMHTGPAPGPPRRAARSCPGPVYPPPPLAPRILSFAYTALTGPPALFAVAGSLACISHCETGNRRRG